MRNQAMLDRFNEIAEKLATDYSDKLLEEMGKLQEELDRRNAWDLDSQLAQAMDAPLPAGRRGRLRVSGGRSAGSPV